MGNEQSSTGNKKLPEGGGTLSDRRSRYEVGESVDQGAAASLHSTKKRGTNLTNTNYSDDVTKSPSRLSSSNTQTFNDKGKKGKQGSSINMPQLHITTESWKKDSFGLFDFECKELQIQNLRHEGTGKILREQRVEASDRRKVKITIKTQQEPLETKPFANLGDNQTALAKLVCEEEGFWLFHSNKVDLTTMFSLPEEKLWLVVKHYNGVIEQSPASMIDGKRGIKLEKNSVIKMGRVRLRVRDIDYAEQFKPIKPILGSPQPKGSALNSPLKKPNSATKLKGGQGSGGGGQADAKNRAATQGEDFDAIVDINEIKLLEEAQNRAEALVAGRLLDQEIAMAKREAKQEKKKSQKVDIDGRKVLITDEGEQGGQPDPTKLTEQSEEAVCRICWSSETEDRDAGNFDEGNPILSPCKCTGTQGSIHLQCLRSWLETKRTRRVHKGQVMLKFNKVDCEICKQVLPFKIAYKNQIVDIVGVEKPQKNFIVLESLNNDEKKVFHIINTEELLPAQGQWSKKKIRIGRGQDSDVRVVDDISVSRNHAFIHRDSNGHYYLTDNNSKFGTLLQLQYPVYLSAKAFANGMAPLAIQSGKTLLHMRVRKTQSCSEKYSCLRACMSCFSRKRQQSVTNLITLDGMFHWPKEFLDLKVFNSNKAQAMVDIESSIDEVEQTAHGKENNTSHVVAVTGQNAAANVSNAAPGADARLLGAELQDPRLLNSQQVQPGATGVVAGANTGQPLAAQGNVQSASMVEALNDSPAHMSLLNNSFGGENQNNAAGGGETQAPLPNEAQLRAEAQAVLQRAITAVPGIMDEPPAQRTAFANVRDHSPHSREEHIANNQQLLQQIREDSALSHRSEAYLVSNIPHLIVPNRNGQLSDESALINGDGQSAVQRSLTPAAPTGHMLAEQQMNDQFTLRANVPNFIGEVHRAGMSSQSSEPAQMRNLFKMASGEAQPPNQESQSQVQSPRLGVTSNEQAAAAAKAATVGVNAPPFRASNGSLPSMGGAPNSNQFQTAVPVLINRQAENQASQPSDMRSVEAAAERAASMLQDSSSVSAPAGVFNVVSNASLRPNSVQQQQPANPEDSHSQQSRDDSFSPDEEAPQQSRSAFNESQN